MMDSLRSLSFILPSMVFSLHQLLQFSLTIHIDFLDAYIDPLCLGAIMPHFILIEHRLFYKKFHITCLELVVISLILSVFSEIVFPWLSASFIADWKDVIAIASGAVWFALTSEHFHLSSFSN